MKRILWIVVHWFRSNPNAFKRINQCTRKYNTLWWRIYSEKRSSIWISIWRAAAKTSRGCYIAMHWIINACSVYLIILFCIDTIIGNNTFRCVRHFTHFVSNCDPNGKAINYLLSKVMWSNERIGNAIQREKNLISLIVTAMQCNEQCDNPLNRLLYIVQWAINDIHAILFHARLKNTTAISTPVEIEIQDPANSIYSFSFIALDKISYFIYLTLLSI